MSGLGPAGEGRNPFENIFGDLARLLGGQGSGPLNWDVARQVATLIAGEGQAEPNVDPLERIRLEELVRIAELHVNQQTGLGVVVRHVEAVSHVDWSTRTLDEYRQLLERLAESLGQGTNDGDDAAADPMSVADAAASPFAQMEQWMSPMLLGMQAGGMVGHLSRRSLGQFDLPIPRRSTDTVLLVPANINVFASDWSLPLDELSLYVSLEEVTRVAILALPHVHQRFTELISEYVSGFQPDTTALDERLAGLDINDPSQLPGALGDPQALLGAIQTPAQQQVLARLNALVAAFVGYVDHTVSTAATNLIPSASAIAEANKRRRVEESDGNRLVEKLFGLELSQPAFGRGEAFVAGVIDRAGADGLARLWQSANELPTPAEVDAPGLWLERIDLPLD